MTGKIKSAARGMLDWVSALPPGFWVLLALALRLAFALSLGERFYQIDEGGYAGPAWQWRTLHVMGTDGLPRVVSPILSGFFGFFFLFGKRLLLPRLGQAVLSAATAVMIGRMTESLTGSPRAGRLALAVSAVYPFFIYYSGMLLSETVYLACATAALWALGSSLRSPSPKTAAAAGLAWALAALTRSEAAPIAALLWAGLAFLCFLKRWSWRAWAVAALCWALPLVGWAARNKNVCGRWTLDTHGGFTLLVGTRFYELDMIDTSVSAQAINQSELFQEAEGLSPVERDRLYFRAAIDFMRGHPALTIRQWGSKFVGFWRFYPRTDKVYAETATSHPGLGLGRGALIAASLLFEPALILGGLAGLWRLRRRPEIWPAVYFIVATMAVHVIVVSMMRYRLPVMPCLIMGFAILADDCLAVKTPLSPRNGT